VKLSKIISRTETELHCVVHEKNCTSRLYDRNVKSERILTKLRALDYEYMCDRNAKFHKKIFITNTRVINILIMTPVHTYGFE